MSVKEGERTKDQLAILGEKNQLLKKQIEDYQTDDYNKWETLTLTQKTSRFYN